MPSDEAEFVARVDSYRAGLQRYCYRILGSHAGAEDVAQETFLRAWERRDSFEGRSGYRTWLYRIATNLCRDALRRDSRQANPAVTPEIPHSGGCSLPPLGEVAAPEIGPDDTVVAGETVELALLAAIQLLPGRQRAVLVLRDVLGWPAGTAASFLGLSIAATNSALQRARSRLRERFADSRFEWPVGGAEADPAQRAALRRYLDAHGRWDVEGLAELARRDLQAA